MTNKHFLLIIVFVALLSNIPASIPDINRWPINTDDYLLLQNEISNDFRFIEEDLKFIYDEAYNDTELKYKIYANDGTVLYSNLDKAVSIRYGRNYIELKFEKTNFGSWATKNPLLLEVTNAKKNKQYLKFNYPK